jgi:hypothetical protein
MPYETISGISTASDRHVCSHFEDIIPIPMPDGTFPWLSGVANGVHVDLLNKE